MNALNVQFDSPRKEFIISSSDLFNADAVSAVDSKVSDITDATNRSGLASTDTILRGAIRSLTPDYTTLCTQEGGALSQNPEASTRFGFPLNSWLEDMLPESIAVNEFFAFRMVDSIASGEIKAGDFPGGDTSKTAKLFSYALWGIWTAFQRTFIGYPVNILNIYNAINVSDAAGLVSSVQTLIREYNFSDSAWPNISVPGISVELATFNPLSNVKFEAVTFKLPVNNSTMQTWATDSTNSSWSYDMMGSGDCNDHACVMLTSIVDGFKQDQVRMLRLCMREANGTQEDLAAIGYSATSSYDYTCKFVSNSSVLIYSVARHVTAEKLNITRSTDDVDLVLTQPRVIFHVTVGRLSWATSDLAQVYGARCGDGVDCNGLYFPLGNGKQHIVVGQANLPTPQQVVYPVYFEAWQVLALSNTQVRAFKPISSARRCTLLLDQMKTGAP